MQSGNFVNHYLALVTNIKIKKGIQEGFSYLYYNGMSSPQFILRNVYRNCIKKGDWLGCRHITYTKDHHFSCKRVQGSADLILLWQELPAFNR